MLHIERFQVNMLQENCYVVSDETKECVIIDCGAFYPEERKAITQYIKENQLKPVHLLVTHGHLDHNFGNNTIYQEFGLKPEVSAADENLMKGLAKQAETFYQMQLDYPVPAYRSDSSRKMRSSSSATTSSPGHRDSGPQQRLRHLLLRGRARSLHGRHPLQELHRQNRFPWRQHVPHHQQPAPSRVMLPDETQVLPGHGEATQHRRGARSQSLYGPLKQAFF